jgi:hypothetical protein
MKKLRPPLELFWLCTAFVTGQFLLNAHRGLGEQGVSADVLDHYVWDLSSLYPDRAAWEMERATIESKLQIIVKLRGTLGRGRAFFCR